jgi:hypothetical protein
MRKPLLKNLFLTVVFSFLLTAILFAIYYESADRGLEEKQALIILLGVADIFEHLLLLLFSLPGLLLAKPKIYNNKIQRQLFYFGGPLLVTLITLISVINSGFDNILLLLPNVLFLAFYTIFYFRLPEPQ